MVVAVYYFMKYVETEALVTIIVTRIISLSMIQFFVNMEPQQRSSWIAGRSLIIRSLDDFVTIIRFKMEFFSIARSQTNGQVKEVNKTIK